MNKGITLGIIFLISFLFIGIGFVLAIPNPAPIYCTNMGYTANETNCIFNDGNFCDLTKFYSGECGKNYTKNLTCKKNGESLSPGYDCCLGLKSINSVSTIKSDGTCAMIVGSFGICKPCGNGVCDSGENKCNCPEDCNNATAGPESTHCQLITTKEVCNNYGANICQWNEQTNSCIENNKNLVGNDSDSHGCKGSAGYSWCEGKKKCLRSWEENCTNVINNPNSCEKDSDCICDNDCACKNKDSNHSIWCEVAGACSTKGCKCVNNKCDVPGKGKVKILPDVASQRARERLGELGFNVTLKEVGIPITGDKPAPTKWIYNVSAEKQGKMFGLFKVKGKVSIDVDAETGEVMKVHKPWWGFMAGI